MSIIYFCLNNAILVIVLKLTIVLYSFNTASASSCESTSENNFDVVVGIKNREVNLFCKSKQLLIPGLEGEELTSSEKTSKNLLDEELEMRNEVTNEIRKILNVPIIERSHKLESHVFKYVKNLLYPDFLKGEKDNPEYKYIVLFAESAKASFFDQSGSKESLTIYGSDTYIAENDIISANLWLFPGNEHVTMSIREVEKYEFNAEPRRVITNQLLVTGEKWYKISMISTVKTWRRYRYSDMINISISCEHCHSPINPEDAPYGLLPFIVLEMKTSYKYDVLPAKNEKNLVIKISEICRKPITFDFKSIGWNDWIVYPESFNTSYCKGSCLSNFDEYYCRDPLTDKKESNIDRYYWKTPPNICCSPIRSSTLEIGYMIASFATVLTALSNITLEECGCIWSPDV